eukprot:1599482-Amphidinium_carterae.2
MELRVGPAQMLWRSPYGDVQVQSPIDLRSVHLNTRRDRCSACPAAGKTAPTALLQIKLIEGSCFQASLDADYVVANVRPDVSDVVHGALSPPPCHLRASLQKWACSKDSTRHSRRSRKAAVFEFKLLSINIRSLAEQGKLVYVSSKLEDCSVDIACVQETRLRGDLDVRKVGEYSLFTTPATRFRGGLMTLVRERHGITPLDYVDTFWRVSRLSVRVNGRLLHIINCHAPITEAHADEHADFAVQFKAVIDPIKNTGKVLVCGDLNGRLRGLDYPNIGPLALSTCPLGATHRKEVLDYLVSMDLYALNTFVGAQDDYTWMHVSGSLHQIDFIFGGSWIRSSMDNLLVGVWGFFDLATTTDHRHLLVTLDLGVTAKAPPKLSRSLRFVDSAHQEEFAKAVQAGVLGTWDRISTPQSYLTKLVDQVADFIGTFRPQGNRP